MSSEFDNLKNLSNQAMVAGTKGWVEQGEVRNALAGIPETAGCLGRMDSAQNGLLRLQVIMAASPAVNAMAEQALVLDDRYDRFAKGIDLIAAGNELLLGPRSAVAESLAALRTRIFPNGMSITRATYLEEAGEADLVKERLRPEDRELLAKVPTMDGNLSSAMDEWTKTGGELGALVRERTRVADVAAENQQVSRADALKARNQWIRVVRTILAGLDLAEEVDQKTRDLILQPLRLAVEKAASKNKSKEQEKGESSTEQPSAT
jgi:hypothetical protein